MEEFNGTSSVAILAQASAVSCDIGSSATVLQVRDLQGRLVRLVARPPPLATCTDCEGVVHAQSGGW